MKKRRFYWAKIGVGGGKAAQGADHPCQTSFIAFSFVFAL